MTKVEAEQALTASTSDCFLVRKSKGYLYLSLMHLEKLHHIKIKYGPGWYELESDSPKYSFPELEDLVTHYRSEVISDDYLNTTLGGICAKYTGMHYKLTDQWVSIAVNGYHAAL